MSSTPQRPASQKRRRSQVYIELPSFDRTAAGHSRSDEERKENSPVKPYEQHTGKPMAVKTPSSKRKHVDEDTDGARDEATPKAKKTKVYVEVPAKSGGEKKKKHTKVDKPQKVAHAADEHTTSEEFPNGFIYCHQCGKKRDKGSSIQCTLKYESGTGRVARCAAKYCRPCLHNRYKIDLDELKAQSARIGSPSKQQKAIHVLDESYFFECFRCRDECNCPACQKGRGAEPLGNFGAKERRAEKAAAKVQATKEKKAKKAQSSKSKTADGASTSASATKPRATPKVKPPKPKPIPKPIWTLAPTALGFNEADERIRIREFVQRFGSVLEVATGHLEELDELSVDSLGDTASWDDGDADPVEVYNWVSELCAKAIVLGLVELFADHAQSTGASAEVAAAKEAAKAIRSSGANLNRVWAALATLRDAMPWLHFRDPLPPPSSTIVRHTRSGMQNGTDAVHIGYAAQFIPVVADMVELAIETAPIREALEAGVAQEKEASKEAKEAIAQENTSWKARTETKDKASRLQHHQTLQDLECSARLVSAQCAPRFMPLGKDHEGRLYFALSPGAGECEAAAQLLRGKDGKVKVGKRKGMWSEDDRRVLQKWSWFVAVWGRRPEGALVAQHDNEESHEDQETWWAFWQPEEISKLAEWIAHVAHLPGEPHQDKDKGQKGSSSGKLSTFTTTSVTNTPKTNGVVRPTIRSRTSSNTSSLTSLSSGRSIRELSPLSDLSDDDSDDGSDDSDSEVDDATVAQGPPSERQLQGLVNGLKEYAEMLRWRIQRVNRDAPEEKDRKSPSAKVDVKSFYG